MMLSPAATPAAGTETVVVVPVELTVAVPMSWTNAISACASDAARLNRNASASVATAGRAGFPDEAARDVRGVSPAIGRAANAATVRAHRTRISLIWSFSFQLLGRCAPGEMPCAMYALVATCYVLGLPCSTVAKLHRDALRVSREKLRSPTSRPRRPFALP